MLNSVTQSVKQNVPAVQFAAKYRSFSFLALVRLCRLRLSAVRRPERAGGTGERRVSSGRRLAAFDEQVIADGLLGVFLGVGRSGGNFAMRFEMAGGDENRTNGQ